MRTLFVCSEAYPLAKTGGLADVSAALPAALQELGHDVRLLLPGYASALDALAGPKKSIELGEIAGFGPTQLVAGYMPDTGLPVWLVNNPRLFHRSGSPYQNDQGRDWPDNAERFGMFSVIAAAVAQDSDTIGWSPDIVHANDWHTGIVAALLAEGSGPPVVFTVHNLAFQGIFSWDDIRRLPLGQRLDWSRFEYYGHISYLKAGLVSARRISTVSPTYANEILTPEFGCGLDGLLRERSGDLVGILNGADYGTWDARTSAHVIKRYHVDRPGPKKLCKALLQRELGLPELADAPLVAFLNRLTHQKMADVLPELIPSLIGRGMQFVVHGCGDKDLEAALTSLAARYREGISVRVGYEEPLAHRILSGADMVLCPSRFEPCGLTQIYAMRFGTLPIVRGIGGLADTVVDSTPHTIRTGTATGFVFDEETMDAVRTAALRAEILYQQPVTWRRIQKQAMRADFSWTRSALAYEDLYQRTGVPKSVSRLHPMQKQTLAG